MADTLAPIGTRTAAASTSPDPVHLLMRAMNSIESAKALLLAQEPMYFFAQRQLKEAQQAIAALAVIDNGLAH